MTKDGSHPARPTTAATALSTSSASVLQADGPMALATWALQFTPRVALLEEAVVMEVEASLRLFGGASALRRRMRDDAQLLGCERMAWAPTSLAALACMRVMQPNGFASDLADVLDALPLETVTAVAEHEPTLARLGCQTLGHVRALPRGGLSRRFGQPLLDGLDLAYGLRPESRAWLAIPDTFQATLELPGRVETAPALMFGAQRLLMLLGAWLSARHVGVRSIVLAWTHDFHRRAAGIGGELRIRTADCTRHVDHLKRLLNERLAQVTLGGPVGALALYADEVELLPDHNGSLFAGHGQSKAQDGRSPVASTTELIERLSARLGAERVLRPALRSDHRLDAMQQWLPVSATTDAGDLARYQGDGIANALEEHSRPRAMMATLPVSSTGKAAKTPPGPTTKAPRRGGRNVLGARMIYTTGGLARTQPTPTESQASLGFAISRSDSSVGARPGSGSGSGSGTGAGAGAGAGAASRASVISSTPAPSAKPPKPRGVRAVKVGRVIQAEAALQPTWLLDAPLPLAMKGEKPLYKGALELLTGPQRMEAGWWDLHSPVGQQQRDYYVAHSERAGLLWVFRERVDIDATHSPWFLHGYFG